jgi:hypothetical protein
MGEGMARKSLKRKQRAPCGLLAWAEHEPDPC